MLSVAVSTLVAAACVGSKLKTDDTEFQLYPQYGQTVILWPVILSLNDIVRNPHLVNPSVVPQTLLTVSENVCVLNVMIFTLSVDFTVSNVAVAKGVDDAVV